MKEAACEYKQMYRLIGQVLEGLSDVDELMDESVDADGGCGGIGRWLSKGVSAWWGALRDAWFKRRWRYATHHNRVKHVASHQSHIKLPVTMVAPCTHSSIAAVQSI